MCTMYMHMLMRVADMYLYEYMYGHSVIPRVPNVNILHGYIRVRDGKMTIFFGPARPVVPFFDPARPVIQFLILGPFGPVWAHAKIC